MSGMRGSGPDDDGAYTVDTRKKVTLRRPERPAPAPRPAREPREFGVTREPRATPAPRSAPRRRRRLRIGRWLALLLVLVMAWVAFMVWVPMNAWGNVKKVDFAPSQRAAAGKGKNYLLVGSDSREGLTGEDVERDEKGAVVDVGQRTDSILLVHVTEGGGTSAIVSLPRDSYVKIPGKDQNKINAAYAMGGPKLLTQTVEQATGLRIDGYLEIGFVGFAKIVNSLGGVELCPDKAYKDEDSGLNVKGGCQTMDGRTSLAYVRMRHADPRGDIGRAERQREFLAAVMKKAATPSTVLMPPRYKGFADAAAGGLTAGNGTSLMDAVSLLRTMRSVGNGDGVSTVVPISNPSYMTKNAGSVVLWNEAAAKTLFTALREDRPISAPTLPKG